MVKKSIKILIYMLIMLVLIFPLQINASSDENLVKQGLKDSKFYRDLKENTISYFNPTSTGSNEKLFDLAGNIVGIVQAIGSVASVVALIALGVKYMFTSVEEKAKYKEELIPYVIGCVLLFAIVNISSAIYEAASKLN